MAKPLTPKKLAVLERRQEVATMRLAGIPVYKIAQHFGVHPGQISRDLRAVAKEWEGSAKEDAAKVRAVELAKIDEIERDAREGWRRSLLDAQKQKISTGSEEEGKGKKKPKGARIEKTSEGQSGNPRFLEVRLNCSKRRAELRGLDAPKQLEHSGPDGEAIPINLIEVVNPNDQPPSTESAEPTAPSPSTPPSDGGETEAEFSRGAVESME